MMATLAPPPPAHSRPKSAVRQDGDRSGGNGRENFGGGGPGRGGTGRDRLYYTGMRVGLAAIIMLFTAFTSAYVVRKGLSNDWRPLQMPRVVWPSTLILLASSLTLERARRAFHDLRRLRFWWATTALLGLLFLAGQVWGWRQLAERGVYVNTNPSSSFFYLLTATHGIHLLGGVTALLFLSRKLWKARLTRGAAGVMALYWHSMDALWVYLLLLLVVWR